MKTLEPVRIFPAYGDAQPHASTGQAGCVVFVVPTNPRALLAAIRNDLEPALADRVFISHGIACVVLILDTATDFSPVEGTGFVGGYELWPYDGSGLVDAEAVERRAPPAWTGPALMANVSDDDLPHTAASQVRQFNANAALIEQRAAYFPEIMELVAWLEDVVRDVADQLRSLGARANTSHIGNARGTAARGGDI